jgi:hypothetical protein
VRELARDSWEEYFDWATHELLHAPISIEIVAPWSAAEAQADHLVTLSYDPAEDVFEVAGAQEKAHLPDPVHHLVDSPRGVFVDSQERSAPGTIAVDGCDGLRTVIRISRRV